MQAPRAVLLLAGVLSAGVASGCGSDEEATPGAAREATVQIRDFKYAPASATVGAGGRVTFVNQDRAPHTATVRDGFDTGTLRQDGRGTVAVARKGTYAYFCEFHPYMKGSIVVR